MSLFNKLKLLLTPPERARDLPRVAYMSPRAAVQAFLNDPIWKTEVLEQRGDCIRFTCDGVAGEWLDDPGGEWLHLRFRDPFTPEQRVSELAMFQGWGTHCAQHTLFRWDIDLERQEYYGDVFILFEPQYGQLECIWAAFNSARLLTRNRNQISLHRSYDVYYRNRPSSSMALALWEWLGGQDSPAGTKLVKSTYREEWYETGSAVCSVVREQWLYYARIAYTNNDFQTVMQGDEEQRLRVYRLHLGLQRRFPHLRNFILETDDPRVNGANETSLAILVSSGTDAAPIFDRMFQEFYEQIIELTEWFHFDFNPSSAPWFDHSVKTPQKGYVRQSAPRGVPDMKEHV